MKRMVLSIVSIIIVIFLSINLFTEFKLDTVQENVMANYPEITKVEAINSLGQWGEWFSEYTLVVEIEGKKARIWTLADGIITYKEWL